MSRPDARCLPLLAVLATLAQAALAQQPAAEPAALSRAAAADLAAIISAGPGPDARPDRIEAALDTLFAELGKSSPDMAQRLPAALAQGAHLARNAERPATRQVMSDLAREMVAEAVRLAGMDAGTEPITRIWADADPVVRAEGPLVMTVSDVTAFQKVMDRAGYKGALSAEAFWDSKSDLPGDRVLPARLGAWAAGAEAAWDELDAGQRRRVAEVLDEPSIPPTEVIEAVTGSSDMIGWLAAVDLALGESDRAASPELVAFLDGGAFAGPLAPLLGAGAPAPMAVPGGSAADQLSRLNNWSASTGEMSSWDSYRAMTQGW